jgi:hypothetical protein
LLLSYSTKQVPKRPLTSTSTVGDAKLLVVMLSLFAVTTAGTVWLPVVTALTFAEKLLELPAVMDPILQM